MRRIIVLGGLMLAWSGIANAEVRLLRAQVHQLSIVQSTGLTSFSGGVNWTPEFFQYGDWYVRAGLGAAMAKGTALFWIGEYQVFVGYRRLERWAFEVGGGAQTWFENTGTYAMAAARASWQPRWSALPFWDRIFIGYSVFPFTLTLTHQFRAGVGIAF